MEECSLPPGDRPDAGPGDLTVEPANPKGPGQSRESLDGNPSVRVPGIDPKAEVFEFAAEMILRLCQNLGQSYEVVSERRCRLFEKRQQSVPDLVAQVF